MANAMKKWLFIALVVLQTVIFGFGNVLTKIAYSDITPLWCLVLRFSLALVVFGALFGRRIVRQLRQISVRSWLPAAVCMALSYIACNVALDLTTATNVGFLVALPPLLGVPEFEGVVPSADTSLPGSPETVSSPLVAASASLDTAAEASAPEPSGVDPAGSRLQAARDRSMAAQSSMVVILFMSSSLFCSDGGGGQNRLDAPAAGIRWINPPTSRGYPMISLSF